MAKIKLSANPTFKAKVSIPIPGGKPEPVEFTFKHMTKDGVLDWLGKVEKKKDAEIILAIASGWELDDEFNSENVEVLCQNYMGSGKVIFETYLSELRGERLKN